MTSNPNEGKYNIIKTGGAVIKELVSNEPSEIITEPQSTLEEQIYAENLYQTALIEMQMLGGM